MINPDIVHGMTYGGIAHGIGAALYEKFTYDENGQLTSGTFMDYLLPSALEIPPIEIVDHCTPSPLTTFGQKGSGEAGYLGTARLVPAVDSGLSPLIARSCIALTRPRCPGYIDRMRRHEAVARLKLAEPAIRALGAASLYLFGSHARDEARPDSDVDVFLSEGPVLRPPTHIAATGKVTRYGYVQWATSFLSFFVARSDISAYIS